MSRTTDQDAPPPGQVCPITGHRIARGNAVRFALIRPGLAERILKDFPGIRPDDFVDRTALAAYRGRYVEDLLRAERNELTRLESEVVASLKNQDILSVNVETDIEAGRTFGERVADHVASFGGSWTFIIVFFAVLGIWMATNVAIGTGAFDPYPFILLNLVLSCVAAVQAPIIMMSQQRQEAKDRKRSENDYRVNLKAELEIRNLHEKIDHLLNRQWERLAEIQTMQIDLIQDLKAARGTPR
ncbi:DUF1003 domain-containing protein [Phreatobacter sp. AB_2022a]|uniref:DUF1003 domain-containing protein n=1 Tax=Phreatobacter sp. AB_2022a TaxID=3003134 RepID=UPI0022876471|nr:DUF1003 domain-containing protein [Phreatobacter sp. AB_2022a]MCZ0733385.1 DUF1003 domain-containing protein [Phreatobacter sp. AB_2022a]